MVEHVATLHTSNTMTLHECCEAMRANLISISEATLAQALVERRLPFGFAVEGKHRAVVIFRHAFYQWLEINIGDEAIFI